MKSQSWRIFSLFVLVLEGFGIRFLDNVIPSPISFWTALLFIINIRSIIKIPAKFWLYLLLIFAFYLGFNLVKHVQPSLFIFAGWFSAFFVLSNYYDGKVSFENDLYKFTRICVVYSLLHFPVLILAKDSLISVEFGLDMKTFMYIFYYTGGINDMLGLNRTQGFCWEPSCWNCLLNLNLALTLSLNKGKKNIILCITSIFLVFSTTGLATMFAIFVFYIFLYIKRLGFTTLFVIILAGLIVAPIAYENIISKLETGSGATRYGDFFIAGYVISTSPLLGADLNNITLNANAMEAKAENWGRNSEQLKLYDEVGMTNAFAALFVEWGLIITLIIFYLMFTSPLYNSRRTAFIMTCTFLFVLMGTPIARTGFFYLFPMSSLLFKRKK